ncbi:restriction endonuclease [Geomonas nitrogeniifigens]|uniref:Restriction endonuclease n=1 Tax=Geomonas diazotrophica TaxID=2843197 RepID=A0ABX8JIV2_9BACT|nr:restriction endonuclease [Geomonas nitrogeniifigens]QWV97207.1 restriction endonuclease [Geomonas nitrogeniifigens]
MARRQRTSPIEDLVTVASKFPWWVSVILAIVSYLTFRAMPSQAPSNLVLPMLTMFGQRFLVPAVLIAAGISAYSSVKQRKLYETVKSRADVGALNERSWGEFETLVAEHFKRQGFEVAREGGNGPDGGIDLVLRKGREKHLVQCKQWKAYKVSVQPVREFYGVMAAAGAAGGYFVTSGTFTEDAKAFVRGLNLELIDGQKLKSIIGKAANVAPAPSTANVPPPVAPQCPRCGAAMQIRVARKGANAGQKFWGCSAYPKCNGTQIIIEAGPTPASLHTAVVQPKEEQKRSCPDCGSELVLRGFQSGPKEGQSFYGCLPCKKAWPVV